MRAAAAIIAAAALVGCAGDGCVQPLPIGFPVADRVSNGIQVRLTERGVRALADNAPAVVAAMLPMGLDFAVPPMCDGSLEVCCEVAPGTCAIQVDTAQYAGDQPRVELSPAHDDAHAPLGVDIRFRVATPAPLPVVYDGLFFNADCEVSVDTERSGGASITAHADLALSQDPVVGTTRIDVVEDSVDVAGLDEDDIEITGTGLCDFAGAFKGKAVDMVADQVREQAAGLIEAQLCASCETDAECAPHATCSDAGVCMLDDEHGERCLQQLGVIGRVPADAILPGLAPDAALDLFAIAGGSAQTPRGGISLGVVAGTRPADTGADSCAPVVPPPPTPTSQLPAMTILNTNAAADVGAFDVAFGLHSAFLDHMAWSLHQAGLLCATLDTSTVELLNADALSALMPSLGDLVDAKGARIAMSLRPSLPPTFQLTGGSSLLRLHWPQLSIDVYAAVDQRLVRLFTAELDLVLDLNIEVDTDGALVPVLGDLGNAFSNVVVTGTGLLDETDEELSGRFASLGELAMPMLVESIGPFALPDIAGLHVRVRPDGVKIIDGAFLTVFGDLETRP